MVVKVVNLVFPVRTLFYKTTLSLPPTPHQSIHNMQNCISVILHILHVLHRILASENNRNSVSDDGISAGVGDFPKVLKVSANMRFWFA